MPSESRSLIRWADKFLRADADQPVGTARALLSEIRWNQWVLLQWRLSQESRFYPFKQKEVLPKLKDANPEHSVVEALHLQRETSSQTILDRNTQVSAAPTANLHEPWLIRKVLLDSEGNPLAIGVPAVHRERREIRRDVGQESVYKVSYNIMGRPAVIGHSASIKTPPPSGTPREYSIIRVFYATDRSSKNGGVAYSNFRDSRETLHFGTCDVTIPRDHQLAKLESPRWWKFEFHWNPRKHITLQKISEIPEVRFFTLLQTEVSKTADRSAFVFVHGFNVSFEEAARRTAQLSYDLGFGGVPILYSWPSAGHLTITGYMADEATIDWARPHLASFLSQIARNAGVSTLHVIAHSMGNRALIKAIGTLPSLNSTSFINQIVLAAPDIDSGEFIQIASSIQGSGKRTTLYASSNDKAIEISKKAHKYPRAGESGPDIVIVNGVDTIDASDVDTSFIGHSYFADKRTVLSDLYYVLSEGKPPSERYSLEEKTSPKGLYWAFKP